MKNTLAKNAAFNIIYRVLNVVFPLISAGYLSRILAPEGIGKVSYAQNIVSYFVMFAALGIPSYGTREIARLKNEPGEANKLFSELVLINAISTFVCIAAYYVFIFTAFSRDYLLYAVLGLELFFNFISIDWLYQGKEEYVYITVRSILIKFFSLLLLFIFVRDWQDYISYAMISCLAVGSNYFFNVFHARKSVKLSFRDLNCGKHLKPVLILMLSTVMASLYSKVDITMLGSSSTDEAVGFYTNAHKVVNIILTLVTAITAVYLPRLSYIYQNEREKYEEFLTTGVKIVLLLAMPCCFGLLVVADDLTMVLFGKAFAPAAATIRILAILILIKGVGDLLCYQAIISSGNEKHLVKSRVLAGIANIVLNSILISRYAQNGAAIASVISELIVNGILLRYSLSTIKLKIEHRFVWSIVLSTAVMSVLAWWGRGQIRNVVLSLVFSVTVGALGYFAAALLLKNDVLCAAISAVKNKLKK